MTFFLCNWITSFELQNLVKISSHSCARVDNNAHVNLPNLSHIFPQENCLYDKEEYNLPRVNFV